MTARTRKKTPPSILNTPATHHIVCTRAGCDREYPPPDHRTPQRRPGTGDFAAVRHAARQEGWLHDEQLGDICPADRDYPFKPLRLAITSGREVPPALPHRITWSTAALPAAERPLEPLPEPDALDDATRKLAALHDKFVTGEDVTAEVDQVVRDYHLQLGDPEDVPGSETDTGGRAEPERGPGPVVDRYAELRPERLHPEDEVPGD